MLKKEQEPDKYKVDYHKGKVTKIRKRQDKISPRQLEGDTQPANDSELKTE